MVLLYLLIRLKEFTIFTIKEKITNQLIKKFNIVDENDDSTLPDDITRYVIAIDKFGKISKISVMTLRDINLHNKSLKNKYNNNYDEIYQDIVAWAYSPEINKDGMALYGCLKFCSETIEEQLMNDFSEFEHFLVFDTVGNVNLVFYDINYGVWKLIKQSYSSGSLILGKTRETILNVAFWAPAPKLQSTYKIVF